jgi:O-succinylbenzoic acid--CoA ligase
LLSQSDNILRSWSAPGWQKKIHIFIQEWLSDAAHMEIFTSGSTGTPKPVRVTKDQMVSSARRTGDFLGLKPKEKALLCLPVDFIAGKMMVVRAFVLGLDLVTVHPSSNPMDGLSSPPDFVALTPMQLHHALLTEKGLKWLGSIRNVIIGGAGMDVHMEKQLEDLPNNIFHTYGMTETLTHVAMRKLNGPHRSRTYHALDGVALKKDVRECLVISDRLLGVSGLVTNDQVVLHAPDEFSYLGRIDNVINSGGVKVNPEVVEDKLQMHLKNRILVAGKKDPTLGEKVILVVELAGSGKPQGLHAAIEGAGLNKFEIPRVVYFMDFFPESSSGKILRRKVLEWIMDQGEEHL